MRWDARRRRYVDANGRVVPEAEVRRRVDKYIEWQQEEVDVEARRVIAGIIFASTLFQFMHGKINEWHTYAGVVAYGGEAEMTHERRSRINAKIESELGYLAEFQQKVSQSAMLGQELTTALAAQAKLYPAATYATYVNNVTAREWDNGVEMGRRTSEDDQASCDECVSAATEEFIPLADIPEIGTLTCLNNCRCVIEYDVGRHDAALPGGISAILDSGTELPA